MMTTSATVGPWRDTGEYDKTLGYCDTTIENNKGEFVAIVRSENGRAQVESNARLIAAAPELLNALQLAEATIMRLNRHESANGTLDVIRAAIAKAIISCEPIKGFVGDPRDSA